MGRVRSIISRVFFLKFVKFFLYVLVSSLFFYPWLGVTAATSNVWVTVFTSPSSSCFLYLNQSYSKPIDTNLAEIHQSPAYPASYGFLNVLCPGVSFTTPTFSYSLSTANLSGFNQAQFTGSFRVLSATGAASGGDTDSSNYTIQFEVHDANPSTDTGGGSSGGGSSGGGTTKIDWSNLPPVQNGPSYSDQPDKSDPGLGASQAPSLNNVPNFIQNFLGTMSNKFPFDALGSVPAGIENKCPEIKVTAPYAGDQSFELCAINDIFKNAKYPVWLSWTLKLIRSI